MSSDALDIGRVNPETPAEAAEQARHAAIGGIAADRLRSFIERIERLEEEKAGLANDIKEVYQEAKSTGFDVKIMRIIVRLRKMEAHSREEQDQLTDLYRRAVGLGAA